MPTIPFLNLGISDLAKIGADTYNAKALGEYEAERRQREDQDREKKRRQEALERALTQLEIEETRVSRDRRVEELGRLRQGLPPTPPRTQDTEHEVGLGTTDFDEYMRRFEIVTDATVDRSGRIAGAQGEARAQWRADNPDEPPNLNEVQDASNEIMEQLRAGNPMITPEEAFNIVTSEEGLAQLTPAVRLLVDGGQVNQGTLAAAHSRANRAQLRQDAVFNELKDAITESCTAGDPLDEIETDIRQNPNFSRYEDPLLEYLDTLTCGQ